VLGGLVRAAEPSTQPEAMRRFLDSDAVADHAAELPEPLLRRLLDSSALDVLS
jgi:hypothetical protein